MKVKIAPSLLSADFSCLEKEIKKMESAQADLLHIDVMDGHFVPNLTIGPCVIAAIRKITSLPLDVHLMIENPQKYVSMFVDAGSNMLTVHCEAVKKNSFMKIYSYLRTKNIKLGISMNPSTPLEKVKYFLEYANFVLVMSVNPGFGGQKFIPEVLPKIKKLRSLFKGEIEVDGGVNDKNALLLIDAGVDILVAGSYIFGAKNPKEAIARLRNGK